jgi:hypothetical protein
MDVNGCKNNRESRNLFIVIVIFSLKNFNLFYLLKSKHLFVLINPL